MPANILGVFLFIKIQKIMKKVSKQSAKFLSFNNTNIYFIDVNGVNWIALKPICTILNIPYTRQLETIKKHDTDNSIKLVSIDALRNMNKKIDGRIHSVPALMFLPSKEIIFGKAVFDHLLLPSRGYLYTKKNSTKKDEVTNSSLSAPIPLNIEPSAFSLGSILSDNYSNIDDDNTNSMNISEDKVYNWTSIDFNQTIQNTKQEEYSSDKKNLPSLEELQKKRDLDIT